MDEDYGLWRLNTYAGDDALDAFEIYTSSDPKTYALKVTALLSSAKLVVRVPPDKGQRAQRRVNNDKERFIIGLLLAADMRLQALMEPLLQDALGWFITIRGYFAGLALLVKAGGVHDPATPVIQPWDPRHTYWAMGKDGLDWACYATRKTASEIHSEFGKKIEPSGPDETRGILVYDFYDGKINTVVTEDQVLKKPEPHGSPRIPVFLGPVGPTPLVWDETTDDHIADVGESVYEATRKVYDEVNFNMSVMKTLMHRTLEQSYMTKTQDGTKTLEENPFEGVQDIPLRIGESVEPLGLLEAAKEAGAYMAMVSGEAQRGSLPHSAYGEIPFQLSGYAINSLRQGMATTVDSRVKAEGNAYTQIGRLLCDQYATGSFATMSLSGRDLVGGREEFNVEITSEQVKAGGEPKIHFVPELPQDDMGRLAMAQGLRDPGPTGMGLRSDRAIREEVLNVQDADLAVEEIHEEMAYRATPLATALTMMNAMEARGEKVFAEIWQVEAMQQVLRTRLELAQLQLAAMGLGMGPSAAGGSSTNGGGGSPPRSRLAPPQAAPSQAQGVPQSAPNPQAGALVPPGSARPGAQQRLNQIGLIAPGQ